MLVLPEGGASMSLKDNPVGGAKTGPTGHGSMGLAHKPIINFTSCRNQIILGLCTYCEL